MGQRNCIMNNPKHNFTIIPNWLVDELSGAELKLYCKMYNGWCLMKDADGWYYRSLSKLKEDLGITCKNRDKLVDRVKKFEELGILAVERCDRKTNRYKFNEDFMFSHEEDTTNDASTPEGYMLVPQKGTSLVPQRGTCLVPQKGTLYNTKIKDKKENTVQYNTVHLQDTVISDNTLKEEINKEEKGVTEQGFLSDNGFSNSSLINEGNKFIHEQDRQGINETVTSKESGKNFGLHTLQELMELENATEDTPTPSEEIDKPYTKHTSKVNTSKEIKESLSMVDGVNLHPMEKRSERLESSAATATADKVMTKEMATAIIKNLGEYYSEGASIMEHQPHKFMVELAHEIPFMDLTNIVPDYMMKHGMDIKDIIILRQDDGKCCSEFEMYLNK